MTNPSTTPGGANAYETAPGPKGRSTEDIIGMAHRHHQSWNSTGDGETTEFALPVTVLRLDDLMVYLGDVLMRPSTRGTAYDYAVRGLTAGWAGDTNRVRFTLAPPPGTRITFAAVGG